MKTIKMKQWLAATLLITTATGTAYADQCALIPLEQAAKALNHLKPGSQYIPFCELCGDKDFHKHPAVTVKELSVVSETLNNDTLWEIKVNGTGIDLAYTYLRVQDGSYLNLSKLADCPSDGVTVGFPAKAVGNAPTK